MNNSELVFRLRKRIFEEWKWKRLTWQEVKAKYGFSKRWYYKYRKRFLKYGDEGLKNKVRDNSNRYNPCTVCDSLFNVSLISRSTCPPR